MGFRVQGLGAVGLRGQLKVQGFGFSFGGSAGAWGIA